MHRFQINTRATSLFNAAGDRLVLGLEPLAKMYKNMNQNDAEFEDFLANLPASEKFSMRCNGTPLRRWSVGPQNINRLASFEGPILIERKALPSISQKGT